MAGAVQGRDELLLLEGLGQIVCGSATHGLGSRPQVRVRRHDDDVHARVDLPQPGDHLDAIDLGHAQIDEGDLARLLVRPLQPLGGVGERPGAVTVILQQQTDRLAD